MVDIVEQVSVNEANIPVNQSTMEEPELAQMVSMYVAEENVPEAFESNNEKK